MTKPRKARAPEKAPAPSALDRMRELTRRIVRVPKSELPKGGHSKEHATRRPGGAR